MLVHDTISELNFGHNILPIIFHILTKNDNNFIQLDLKFVNVSRLFVFYSYLVGLGISASLILQAVFKTSKGPMLWNYPFS